MRADAEGSGEAAGGRKVAAALLGALRADGHASRSAEALYAMWEHAFDEAEALQVELTKLRELPPPPAVGEEQASRRTLSAPPRSNPSARISRSPTAPAPARSAAPTAMAFTEPCSGTSLWPGICRARDWAAAWWRPYWPLLPSAMWSGST